MTTFLGILLCVVIFVFVARAIRHKDASTTLPHNPKTGLGGITVDDKVSGDTGKDEHKLKP